MNAHKLQQDHPCVIEIIRRHFLKKPSPPNVPLKLESSNDKDPSPGQSGVIFKLLKNKVPAMFFESFMYPLRLHLVLLRLDERILC